MSDLRELYQSVILDHNKKPRNFGALEGANRYADGVNPLCGDKLRVYLTLEGDRVEAAGFEGSGCAISKASASLMTESIKGKAADEVLRLFESFHELLTKEASDVDPADLGKLAVFSGVREFPVRVKCATLAWHAMRAALEGNDEPVKTE